MKGAWKPTVKGCVMGSGGGDYCCVCREQIVKRIYAIVDPIDECSTKDKLHVVEPGQSLTLFVRPMRPATHALEIEWRIERAGDAPPVEQSGDLGVDEYGRPIEGWISSGFDEVSGRFPRLGRRGDPLLAGGPLKPKSGPKGLSEVVLKSEDLEPGYWRIQADVHDKTPWVIKDERRLLGSRATFHVFVKPLK
jgi:hypothetical protein